jgi:hypothetical protein
MAISGGNVLSLDRGQLHFPLGAACVEHGGPQRVVLEVTGSRGGDLPAADVA